MHRVKGRMYFSGGFYRTRLVAGKIVAVLIARNSCLGRGHSPAWSEVGHQRTDRDPTERMPRERLPV